MPRKRINALLLIFASLSAMGLIIHDLHARRHGEASYRVAQAIAGGYDGDSRILGGVAHRTLRPLSNDPEMQDDQLRADELEAGAVWARAHHAKRVVDCPTESRVFYSGCVAAMRGQWPDQPD